MLLASLGSPNRKENVIRGDVTFERDSINLLQLNNLRNIYKIIQACDHVAQVLPGILSGACENVGP